MIQHALDIGPYRMAALEFNPSARGMPAVFIHGISSSVNFWVHSQTPLFKDNRRWFSLSLPGHYPATVPASFRGSDLTPDLIADLTAAAIRELMPDTPVILAGHSTGAFAALVTAARHPQMVAGVMSASGFVQGRWIGSLGALQRLVRLNGMGRMSFRYGIRLMTLHRAVFEAALRANVHDTLAVMNNPHIRQTLALLYEDMRHVQADGLIPYFRRMPDIDIRDWLEEIAAPVLVITGDRDAIVPPVQSQLIVEGVSCGELVIIRGAGHIPIVERAADYHAAVTAWMDSVRL